MGFISLVNEIQFMLISSRHISNRSMMELLYSNTRGFAGSLDKITNSHQTNHRASFDYFVVVVVVIVVGSCIQACFSSFVSIIVGFSS